MGRPKQPNAWQNNICQQCQTVFLVRRCYVKRGQGKFCSFSCGIIYRNIHNNPAKRPEVREKISKNHYDFNGLKVSKPVNTSTKWGKTYRSIAFEYKPKKCELCGKSGKVWRLEIHHKDGNRKNNELDNLQVLCVLCHQTIIHGNRQKDSKVRYLKEVILNASIN